MFSKNLLNIIFLLVNRQCLEQPPTILVEKMFRHAQGMDYCVHHLVYDSNQRLTVSISLTFNWTVQIKLLDVFTQVWRSVVGFNHTTQLYSSRLYSSLRNSHHTIRMRSTHSLLSPTSSIDDSSIDEHLCLNSYNIAGGCSNIQPWEKNNRVITFTILRFQYEIAYGNNSMIEST